MNTLPGTTCFARAHTLAWAVGRLFFLLARSLCLRWRLATRPAAARSAILAPLMLRFCQHTCFFARPHSRPRLPQLWAPAPLVSCARARLRRHLSAHTSLRGPPLSLPPGRGHGFALLQPLFLPQLQDLRSVQLGLDGSQRLPTLAELGYGGGCCAPPMLPPLHLSLQRLDDLEQVARCCSKSRVLPHARNFLLHFLDKPRSPTG